jgi:hypothetical protein
MKVLILIVLFNLKFGVFCDEYKVKIDGGFIAGEETNDFFAFSGIPYAEGNNFQRTE